MFSKKNIQDIPIEETPHATGSRKLLVAKNGTSSQYFEAYTYGYLPANEKWAMHKHNNIENTSNGTAEFYFFRVQDK